MRGQLRFGAALLAAVGLVVPNAYAADEGLVLRQSAERLAAADRCEEAIEKARRARALAPGDAPAAALEGRCAIHLMRYAEAIAPLEAARRLEPSMPLVSTDLAMAHFHLRQFDAADAALTEAEKTERDHPKVLLYRGLLHLELAEDVQAATSLERAARADNAIDPLASYYASLAWQRANERQKARSALERLQAQAPSSEWARQATAALERLDAAADVGLGEWWATVTGGVEWDDNVVLRGEDVRLPNRGTPQQIGDQQDLRGFWSTEVGAELFRTRNWAGGAIAGYYGNAHVDTHAFDVQSPTVSLWVDRRIDEQTFIRLQPYYGYVWTSTDPFLSNVGGTLAWHQVFGEAGSGRLYGQYGYRDYLYTTHDPATKETVRDAAGNDISRERNRDGTDLRVGYDHSIDVTESTGLRAGVYHGRYESNREYSHVKYGGYVGISQSLPFEFELDLDGAYSHEPYRHASTFPIPDLNSTDRRDDIWSVRARLERPITDVVSVATYWHWEDHASNTRPWDYDRNIIGGQFTLSFGP